MYYLCTCGYLGAAQNALADRMWPAGLSLPTPGLTNGITCSKRR